jgi:hypothetical protein
LRRFFAFVRARRFTVIVVGVIVVLLVAASFIQVSLDDSATAHAGWSKSSPLDTGRSVLDVLGGVRQTLAAYMWTKTDTIFHQYLGHNLKHEQPLFPYYWLISRLDPHFTMAVYYASWMLCEFGRVDEGLALALEGVKDNPDSAILQENLANIYLFFKKDPAKARYHGAKAIELSKSKDERDIMQMTQNLINDIIAGKKKVPKVIPIQTSSDLTKKNDKD